MRAGAAARSQYHNNPAQWEVRMHSHVVGLGALSLAALISVSSGASGQLALSANDGKAVLVDGVNSVPANPPPDTVTVIDLSATPPKVVAELQAPASVVGPPLSVAVARDEGFALVTGATKVDPSDPKKTVPDDKLTVIDLKASPPKISAQLQAGKGAAGVSINRAGTLALVANRSEGTVSVFSIAGHTLTPVGKINLGDDKSGPSHVAITPDGKTALVTRDGDNKISVLSIDGSKVEDTKREISAGLRPYGLAIHPNGQVAVVANIGTSSGDADTMSLIDIEAKPARVVQTVTVGQTPEGIVLSPDGAFAAVNVVNGSNKAKNSPFFNDYGLVKVLSVKGKELVPLTEAKVGHWCQGLAWSKDNRTLLVQCMVEKEIMVFNFDGKELKPAGSIKLSAGPAGIRTAEP
jgi:6-phosphogluconolactonase (cycloisomerase 2 family)